LALIKCWLSSPRKKVDCVSGEEKMRLGVCLQIASLVSSAKSDWGCNSEGFGTNVEKWKALSDQTDQMASDTEIRYDVDLIVALEDSGRLLEDLGKEDKTPWVGWGEK
jgi:hypothetical protein